MPIDISTLTPEEIEDLRRQLGEHAPGDEYTKWNWTLTNRDLSFIHNMNVVVVGELRRVFGHRKGFPIYKAKDFDWFMSDSELARKNKLDIKRVESLRKQLNKPNVAPNFDCLPAPKPVKALLYESLDWSKSDVDISREAGLTRERIRQIRAQLGKPKRNATIVKFEKFKSLVNGRKQLKWSEVAGLMEISSVTFGHYCRRLGILRLSDSKKTEYPWELMNWQIPNSILTDVWRIRSFNGVAAHRCNHHMPNPSFKCVAWSIAGNVPAIWQSAVEAEKKKASEYYASKNTLTDDDETL